MSETNRRRGGAALFWFMFLSGGACLAACLLLPPWLEYQSAAEQFDRKQQTVDRMEYHLRQLAAQIDHTRHDAAYNERLAQREFGLTTPGVRLISIDPEETAPQAQPDKAAHGPQAQRPALTAGAGLWANLTEKEIRNSPLMSVFVLEQTRPLVMAMSGVTMLTSLILLGRCGRAA